MSAAVSFAATGKLPVRSGRNGARSLVPLNRVYTVVTQASTGPPRRSESNEMEHIVASGACLIVNLSAGVASESARFSLSVVGPSHPVVVPLRVAQAGRCGFSDPRSFLPFSLSAACIKFCQTHLTTLLQEWPAFRFRAAPPGDDPTLIDRVAA